MNINYYEMAYTDTDNKRKIMTISSILSQPEVEKQFTELLKKNYTDLRFYPMNEVRRKKWKY
jgi:hypothetical protein